MIIRQYRLICVDNTFGSNGQAVDKSTVLKIAFARRGSISDVSFSYRFMTERLGGLVLKDKQEEALKSLLDGKDVFAVRQG